MKKKFTLFILLLAPLLFIACTSEKDKKKDIPFDKVSTDKTPKDNFGIPINLSKELRIQYDSLYSLLATLGGNLADTGFLSLWEKTYSTAMKEEVFASSTIPYYLFYYKNLYYYNAGNVDSVYRYTELAQKESLAHQEIHDQYYYQATILADACISTGKTNRAIEVGKKIMKESAERKDTSGVYFGEYILGLSYMAVPNFAEAIKHFDKSNTHFEKSEDWPNYVASIGNTMNCFIEMNKIEMSKELFIKADSVLNMLYAKGKVQNSKEVQSFDISAASYAEIYSVLGGSIFSRLSDVKEVDYIFEKVKNIYSSAPPMERVYYYNIARYHASAHNDYAMALAYGDSLMTYYKENQDLTNYNRIVKGCADTYSKQGNYHKAYEFLSMYDTMNDSLSTVTSNQRLNALATEYHLKDLELNNLRLSAKINRHRAAVALLATAALMVIIIIMAISYRHIAKLNKMLRKKAAELAETNKRLVHAIQIKNSLFQNINHEIRTPLNSIVGFSGFIADSVGENNQDLIDAKAKVELHTKNLLKLIDEMLRVSEMGLAEVRIASFSIRECCKNISDKFTDNKVLPSGVKFSFTAENGGSKNAGTTEDAVAVSSEDTVSQVLMFLLDNAAKFTKKGKINLSYSINKENNSIRFAVTDTGIGIKKENKEKVFEKFFKENTYTQGLGLGLSVARMQAEQIGGKIWQDPDYTDGCRFFFEISLKG